MAKAKKMAVRTSQPRQRKINFNAPKIEGSIVRKLGGIFLLLVGVAVAMQGKALWHKAMPVEQIGLVGELRFYQHQDLVEFVRENNDKGMLAIDLAALRTAVNQIDWIDQVDVRKVWPNQLVFEVTEHRPVARIGDDLLTHKGSLIKNVQQAEFFFGLPQISIAKDRSMALVEYQEIWRQFQQMRRQFEILSLSLEQLEIDRVNNWQLHFAEGVQMNLGRKQRLERVDRLVDVYSAIANPGQIKFIDLRYHNGLSIEWQQTAATNLKG